MLLADLNSYLEADKKLCEVHADKDAWAHKATLNIANSGSQVRVRSLNTLLKSGRSTRFLCHRNANRGSMCKSP